MTENKVIEIRPQKGYQEKFLSSSADIAIGGGAAGAGKTYSLLMEGLRHKDTPGFNGIFFRRSIPEITNPGGLWDEASQLYPLVDLKPKTSPRRIFENVSLNPKFKLTFAHMQREETVYDYQGAQIPFIAFDEVTHFTEKQFFYMLSRSRSVTGVRPYVRATCNPDPDSFIRDLIDWWIGEDGLAIPERCGQIRWFCRIGEELFFDDHKENLIKRYGNDAMPKSLTFIAGSLLDNKILTEKDPGYLANLRALSKVDQERLEKGNWDVRPINNRVAHAFDDKIHVNEFNRQDLPVYIGQDFNVSPMCGVVCELTEEKLFIFDEIYLGKNGRSNTYELSEHINRKFGSSNIVPDSTGKAKKTSSKKTDHEILKDAGHKVKPFLNPFREDRFNFMNGCLEKNMIVIHPRCKNLIASLLNFQDDKATEKWGHIIDAFGYIIWYAFKNKGRRSTTRQL